MPKRIVTLTDYQLAEIGEYFASEDSIGRTLAAMLAELSEIRARKSRVSWDCIFRLANVDREKETAVIDRLSKQIVVYEKDDPEIQAP